MATTGLTGTAGPTTGGGADSTGADDTTTGASCPGAIQTLVPPRPTVMLVIDRSGRMVTTWDHDGIPDTADVTFWSGLHAEVSATLAKYEDRVDFGATTFPASTATADYSETACVVSTTAEVVPGQKNGDAILAALPPGASLTLAGGDPITAALRAAIGPLKLADPTQPRRILLITNGLAQCSAGAMGDALFESYDGEVALVVAEALGIGIPVHVIGVGVSDTTTPIEKDGAPDNVSYFAKYNELAVAGGTAPFVNANIQAALPAALAGPIEAALAGVKPCVVALEVPVMTAEQTTVMVAGEPLMRVAACGGPSGWRFVGDLPYTAIELCGAACTSFQELGAVDVFACEPPDRSSGRGIINQR